MTLLSRWLAALLVIAILGSAGSLLAAGRVSDPLPKDQIEQLVAPLALYPDALLTQMLMASTYPLDLVQADRWVQAHRDLKGEALDRAVREEPWDESVKVMVQFPSVLSFMSNNLDWTQDLGDAVLSQLQEVMDAIQKLRREAEQAGSLKSNDKQRVEKAGDTIVIQPAQAETVYVPAYDPAKVYGAAPAPETTYYPAVYQAAATSYSTTQPESYVTSPPATTVYTSETNTNEALIGFGAGALVGGLLTAAIMWDDDDHPIYWGGPGYWNGQGYWNRPDYWRNNGWRNPNNINVDRDLNIDRNRINTGDINIDRDTRIMDKDSMVNRVNQWQHNPERRGGVPYRDQASQRRFSESGQIGAISRDEARGRLTSSGMAGTGPKAEIARPGTGPKAEIARPGTGPKAEISRPGTGTKAEAARPGTGPKTEIAKPGTGTKAEAAKAGARPKAEAAKASRRPVDASAKHPTASQAQGTVRPQASGAGIQQARGGAAVGGAAAGQGAFSAYNPGLDRVASQRGATSRAMAGRAPGGAGLRGGGDGRAGIGHRR